MKKYRYSATTTFYDFGEVEAENEQDARIEVLSEVADVIREKRYGEIAEDTVIEMESEATK